MPNQKIKKLAWQRNIDSMLDKLSLESRRSYYSVCSRILDLSEIRFPSFPENISLHTAALKNEQVDNDSLTYILCNLHREKIVEIKSEVYIGKKQAPMDLTNLDEIVNNPNASLDDLKEAIFGHPRMEIFFRTKDMLYFQRKLQDLGFTIGKRKPERLLDEIDGDFYFNGRLLEIDNKQAMPCKIMRVLIKNYVLDRGGVPYTEVQRWLLKTYDESEYEELLDEKRLAKRIENALTSRSQYFFLLAKIDGKPIKNQIPYERGAILELRNKKVFFHNLPISNIKKQ